MQRLCDGIVRCGITRCESAGRAAVFIAPALMLGLAMIMLSCGAPVMAGRPWDVPVLVDGAWRIVNGQIPHNDFFSHIGALPFYLSAAGIKLIGPSIKAIVCGNTILMVALIMASAMICYKRTTTWILFLITCYIPLLAVTPRPLGDPYFFHDFAMLYNRMGEAIIFILSLSLFLPPQQTAVLKNVFETMLQAVLLVALLFIKLNYFVVGIGFVFGAAILGSFAWKNAGMLIIAVLLLLFLAFGATGIAPSAMLGDFHVMTGAQNFREKLAVLCIVTLKATPVIIGILSALAVRWIWHSDLRMKDMFMEGGVSAMVIGGGLLLTASNCQRNEMPLLGVIGIFLGDLTLKRLVEKRYQTHQTAPQILLVCIFMAALIMPTFKTDIQSTLGVIANKLRWPNDNPVFKNTNLGDFRFSTKSERTTDCLQYERELVDGLALLQANRHLASKTTAVLFSNPFDFALGWIPSKGGAVCIAPNTINERSHPPLTALLRSSHFVLTTKDQTEFQKIYGSELASYDVSTVADSTYYILLKVISKTGKQPRSLISTEDK